MVNNHWLKSIRKGALAFNEKWLEWNNTMQSFFKQAASVIIFFLSSMFVWENLRFLKKRMLERTSGHSGHNSNENDKNNSANVSMISKKSDSLFSMYEEWSESD